MVEMPRPENFQTAAPVTPSPVHNWKIAKRAALAAGLLLGSAGAYHYGSEYWTVGRFLQSTDDAYVKTDFTIVAPKVSGYIASVPVADNEAVTTGPILARIDDRDFRAALAQARADVAASEAVIRNFDAELVLQQAVIAQADATIVATGATLTFAQADADRYRALNVTGAGTVQHAQQTESLRAQAAAQLQRDEAAAVAAKGKVDVLKTGRAQAEAQHDKALAVARQADLNLSYTVITAPVDGTVGARSLRVGQYVTAGTQLMAVVPLHAAYVVANFKETQLTYVRPGQPVDLDVDGFPGRTVKAHVDSLSPASGLEFSLLPPDNATGNFTKIVQRIPVKIIIDGADLTGLLRSGMSVEPTIDTKQAVLAEQARTTAAAALTPEKAAWLDRVMGDVLAGRHAGDNASQS